MSAARDMYPTDGTTIGAHRLTPAEKAELQRSYVVAPPPEFAHADEHDAAAARSGQVITLEQKADELEEHAAALGSLVAECCDALSYTYDVESLEEAEARLENAKRKMRVAKNCARRAREVAAQRREQIAEEMRCASWAEEGASWLRSARALLDRLATGQQVEQTEMVRRVKVLRDEHLCLNDTVARADFARFMEQAGCGYTAEQLLAEDDTQED